MSHYCDDSYDVYHEVRVFASKEHECDAVMCDEPIRKGDPYWRVSVVFNGQAETIKRCIRCQTIHEHLRDRGEDTWPDERLACGQDYEEEWGRPPPPEIQALAFWRAGEKLPARHPCTWFSPYAHALGSVPTCYQWTSARRYHTAQWAACKRVI